MKKIIVVFFILFSVAAYAQFNIYGTVQEYGTNKPVGNAIVKLNVPDTVLITDEEGKFKIECDTFPEIIISHLVYETNGDGVFINSGNHRWQVNFLMTPKNTIFPEVVITGSRADFSSPVTYTNISGEELNKNNFGEDMPMLLEFTPSAVVTSDAGNGTGYTGIRIRGSDATRINVTINGVPYNDAESEQTYWVDLPDIAASVDDIQIQRGIGTSSNGISSLGGAININTNSFSLIPYANATIAAGSFNLLKTSASFGTGTLNEHWNIEGRISRIKSDGFIDRSFADLTSFYIAGSYRCEKYASVLNVFSGEEHTYQSWGGVPKDSLETNRTFNPYTYENQTDNYTQTHYQWHQYFYFKNSGKINFTMNYTKGFGYYEQLETGQYFSDYGVDDVIIGADTINSSDFITRKWLDNDYYGAFINYENKFAVKKLELRTGAAFYQYTGDHFGKIIWSEFASTLGPDYEWYRNDAVKNDGNVFAQLNFHFTDQLSGWMDLQLRSVSYMFTGYDYSADEALLQVDQNVDLLFFNPKIGMSYQANRNQLIYLSLSKSGKEPNRDDYVESSTLSRPAPEILYDAETGYKMNLHGWQLQTNLYYMYYVDQLVLNGQINDVGSYTRINVPQSFRRGIELAWAKTFFSRLNWNANLTISQNQIKEYTEFIDNWDTGEQSGELHQNTKMAFSPACIAADQIDLILLNHQNNAANRKQNLSVGLQSKFVGRQFIDNTESNERSLDPYFINDFSLNYNFSGNFISGLGIKFMVQNIFNHQYESNAWVYRYIYEGSEQELNGYFPQAGRNYVLSMSLHI